MQICSLRMWVQKNDSKQLPTTEPQALYHRLDSVWKSKYKLKLEMKSTAARRCIYACLRSLQVLRMTLGRGLLTGRRSGEQTSVVVSKKSTSSFCSVEWNFFSAKEKIKYEWFSVHRTQQKDEFGVPKKNSLYKMSHTKCLMQYLVDYTVWILSNCFFMQ